MARLGDHVHDLETRKRAPLYQKRQEEELKAALDKAAGAEEKAQAAEAARKQAKVRRSGREVLPASAAPNPLI